MPRFKIAAALVALFASVSLIAEVAGTYEITIEGGQGGGMTSTLVIEKDEEGNYSAEMTGFRGETTEIDEVTVDENKFSFTITRETQRGNFSLEYSGEVDGDKITGKMSSDWGDMDFKGTRQAEEEEDSGEESEAAEPGDQT